MYDLHKENFNFRTTKKTDNTYSENKAIYFIARPPSLCEKEYRKTIT